jgi:hypothetical protein
MEVQEKQSFAPSKKRTSGKQFTSNSHVDHVMTVQVRLEYMYLYFVDAIFV